MNENIIKTIIELIGYTGSILVVVSMLMTSVSKLRVVNTLGSIIFAIYALIIKSYPTAGLQVALIVINAVKLYKLSKNKSPYTITELKKDDSYIQFFTDFYKKDISHYFPNAIDNFGKAYIIRCGNTPAGLLLAHEETAGALEIDLDYTTPSYRDCSVGKFLYQQLAKSGVKQLSIKNNIPEHTLYLKRMGFISQGERFVKAL